MVQNLNKMAYTAKDRRPPWRFLYLRETTSWWCGEGDGEGENVHLLTHAPTRGVGKKWSNGLAQSLQFVQPMSTENVIPLALAV